MSEFKTEGKRDFPLIIAFVLINSLVFLNAILHDPSIGYDSLAHIDYVSALSKFHLVGADQSDEFFSPPLPYLFPATFLAIAGDHMILALKFAQLVNVALSLGLTFFLIKICRLLTPKRIVALGGLVFLGILPAYYKTLFSFAASPMSLFFLQRPCFMC